MIVALVAVAVLAGATGAMAQETEKKPAWPKKIEPFVLGDPEGPGTMRISIVGQALLRLDAADIDSPDDTETDTTVAFRRLRLVLSGHVITKKLTWVLHLSLLPGSLELLDFTLEYNFNRWAKLRVGNTKLPFTRYRNNSFQALSMVDWAVVTPWFGAERMLGIVLHNGYGTEPGLQYEIGLMTGDASRPQHANGLATNYGEKMGNHSDLTQPAAGMKVHPEIALHLAWSHGVIGKTEADVEGGPFRISIGASGSWDTRPNPVEDLSFRFAPEIWLKAYGFAFQATGYGGFVQLDGNLSETAFAASGVVTRASYCVKGLVDIAFQYAMISVTRKVRQHAKDRADSIIAAAIADGADPADIDALETKYKNAGAIERKQEISFGVTVFIIGQSLKWANDVAYVLNTKNGLNEHDIRFRSQLQVTF